MRLLFFGDVVGRTGRDALITLLPGLIQETQADFVTVNGENAAGGYGITLEIAKSFFGVGVDCITTGNHAWDQKTLIPQIDQELRILRPANYPPGTPGRGSHLYSARNGQKVWVANIMGRLGMDALDDPFQVIERELVRQRLGATMAAAILDIHAEATSEKMALGHWVDGRVSLAVGTHTHIPTADAQILPGGTAYQTDAGMCGDYDSVIGMKKDISIARFVRKMPGERMTPAEGDGTICGVLVETNDRTGLAETIRPIRRGGRLAAA